MNRLINQKMWLDIVRLRASNANLTYEKIGRVLGVTRQRAHQIENQALRYAAKHNDELAKKITELVGAE